MVAYSPSHSSWHFQIALTYVTSSVLPREPSQVSRTGLASLFPLWGNLRSWLNNIGKTYTAIFETELAFKKALLFVHCSSCYLKGSLFNILSEGVCNGIYLAIPIWKCSVRRISTMMPAGNSLAMEECCAKKKNVTSSVEETILLSLVQITTMY